MTRRIRAAYCITQPLSNEPATSIWISDALLADVFSRFAYRHIRHSSSVPGPLEARRRATKRKNASLAYCEARNAQFDPTLLPPSAPPLGWWQEPNPPPARPVTPRLMPSMLPRFFPPPIPPSSRTVLPRFIPSLIIEQPDPPIHRGDLRHTSLDVVNTQSTLESDVPQEEISVKLDKYLERSHSVGDIHELLRHLDVNLQRHPDISEHIFAHMLRVGWEDQHLAEYLESPVLNPTGSINHLRLIRHLQHRSKNQNKWRVLFQSLCKATRLGLVTPDSFEEIIRLLPGIRLRAENGHLRIRTIESVHQEENELLEALEDSKVLGVDNLQASFVHDWLSRVLDEPISASGIILLWTLRKFVDLEQKQAGSKLLVQVLKSTQMKDPSRTPAVFARFLLLIPTPELIPSVFQATNLLVIESQQGKTDPSLIKFWHDVLSSFNNKTVTNICLSAPDLTEALAVPYLILNSEEQLLILAWTIFSISVNQAEPRNQLAKIGFQQKFDDVFDTSAGKLTQDLLGRVVLCLERLSLPCKQQLLENLRYFTDGRLVVFKRTANLQSDINTLTGRVLSQLADDSFYMDVRDNYNDALVELAESVNKDIEQFKTLSRALIHKNKKTFSVVTHILNHNRAFQIALSQSFPQRIAWKQKMDAKAGKKTSGVEAYVLESQTTESECASILPDLPVSTDPSSDLTQSTPAGAQVQPEEALNVMNHLAISYALSRVHGSRSALRKVYWCFQFLHRYGAPIQVPVTRALWHAGATRYGPDGTSVTLLKWLLKQIEEVEGREVARSLLLSSTFRSQRRGDLEVFDWSDYDLEDIPSELKEEEEDENSLESI